MNTRERRPEERPVGSAPAAGGSGPGELQARASELLEAGDRAIARALSEDSARFLSQNRQSGGQ
jgi:hypothetical protein